MPKGIRKWQPIVVKWVDAFTMYGSLQSNDYLENYEPMIRRTAGLYLGRSDHGVFITETDDRLKVGNVDCDTITCIPTGMVLQIEIPALPVSSVDSPKPASQSKPQKKTRPHR